MNKSSIPWTTKQISKMVDNKSLVFDNVVQRSFVWDKNRMSLLIDSILRNYPIPPFYAIKTDDTVTTPKGDVKVFDCLDGKQRCTTINKFMNNEFKLTGLDQILSDDGMIDLNGLTHDELPEDLKDQFDTYSLTVYGFTEVTPEEVVEIMRRLNNGKPLSAIDLTRIRAKDLAGIKTLGQHPLFEQCLTEKARDAHQQEDIIVKVWAQLQNPECGLDNKDVKPLYETLEITGDVETRLKRIFDAILSIRDNLVENNHKKTAKKLVTKTHLISVSYIIDKALDEDRPIDDIATFLDTFFDDGTPSCRKDYNAACMEGSNHAANVKARIDALMAEYDWYFNGEETTDDSVYITYVDENKESEAAEAEEETEE